MDDRIFDTIVLQTLNPYVEKKLALVNDHKTPDRSFPCHLLIQDEGQLLSGFEIGEKRLGVIIDMAVDRFYNKLCHDIQIKVDQTGTVLIFEQPQLESKKLFDDPTNSIIREFENDTFSGLVLNSINMSDQKNFWNNQTRWKFINALLFKLQFQAFPLLQDIDSTLLDFKSLFGGDNKKFNAYQQSRVYTIILHFFPYRIQINYRNFSFIVKNPIIENAALGDTIQTIIDYTRSYLDSQKNNTRHLTIEWKISKGRRLMLFYSGISFCNTLYKAFPSLTFQIQLSTQTNEGHDVYVWPREFLLDMKSKAFRWLLTNSVSTVVHSEEVGKDMTHFNLFILYVFASRQYDINAGLSQTEIPIEAMKELRDSLNCTEERQKLVFLEKLAIQRSSNVFRKPHPIVIKITEKLFNMKEFDTKKLGDALDNYDSILNEKNYQDLDLFEEFDLGEWTYNYALANLHRRHRLENKFFDLENKTKKMGQIDVKQTIAHLVKSMPRSAHLTSFPKKVFEYIMKWSPVIQLFFPYFEYCYDFSEERGPKKINYAPLFSNHTAVLGEQGTSIANASNKNMGLFHGIVTSPYNDIKLDILKSHFEETLRSVTDRMIQSAHLYNAPLGNNNTYPSWCVIKHHFPKWQIEKLDTKSTRNNVQTMRVHKIMVEQIQQRIFYDFDVKTITQTLSLLLSFYNEMNYYDHFQKSDVFQSIIDSAIRIFSLEFISEMFYCLRRLDSNPHFIKVFKNEDSSPSIKILCLFLSKLANEQAKKQLLSLPIYPASLSMMPTFEEALSISTHEELPKKKKNSIPSPQKKQISQTTSSDSSDSDHEMLQWQKKQLGARRSEFKELILRLMKYATHESKSSMLFMFEKLKHRLSLSKTLLTEMEKDKEIDKTITKKQQQRVKEMEIMERDVSDFLRKSSDEERNRDNILLDKYPEIKKYQQEGEKRTSGDKESSLLQTPTKNKPVLSTTKGNGPPQEDNDLKNIRLEMMKYFDKIQSIGNYQEISQLKLAEMLRMLLFIIDSETTLAYPLILPRPAFHINTNLASVIGKRRDYSFRSRQNEFAVKDEWEVIHEFGDITIASDKKGFIKKMKRSSKRDFSPGATAIYYLNSLFDDFILNEMTGKRPDNEKHIMTIEKECIRPVEFKGITTKSVAQFKIDLLHIPVDLAKFVFSNDFISEAFGVLSRNDFDERKKFIKHLVFDKYIQFLHWQNFSLDSHIALSPYQFYHEEAISSEHVQYETKPAEMVHVYYVPYRIKITGLITDTEREQMYEIYTEEEEEDIGEEEFIYSLIQKWTHNNVSAITLPPQLDTTFAICENLMDKLTVNNYHLYNNETELTTLSIPGITYLVAKSIATPRVYTKVPMLVVAVIFNIAELPHNFNKNAFLSYIITNNYIFQSSENLEENLDSSQTEEEEKRNTITDHFSVIKSQQSKPQDISFNLDQPRSDLIDENTFLELLCRDRVPFPHLENFRISKPMSLTESDSYPQPSWFRLKDAQFSFHRHHSYMKKYQYAQYLFSKNLKNQEKNIDESVLLDLSIEFFGEKVFIGNDLQMFNKNKKLWDESRNGQDSLYSTLAQFTFSTLEMLDKFIGIAHTFFDQTTDNGSLERELVPRFISFWLSPLCNPRFSPLITWANGLSTGGPKEIVLDENDLFIFISRVFHRHPGYIPEQSKLKSELVLQVANEVLSPEKRSSYKFLKWKMDQIKEIPKEDFLMETDAIEDDDSFDNPLINAQSTDPFIISVYAMVRVKYGELRSINSYRDLFAGSNTLLHFDDEEGGEFENIMGNAGETDELHDKLLKLLKEQTGQTIITFLRDKNGVDLQALIDFANQKKDDRTYSKRASMFPALMQLAAYTFGCLQVRTKDKTWNFSNREKWEKDNVQDTRMTLAYLKSKKNENTRGPLVVKKEVYELFKTIAVDIMMGDAIFDSSTDKSGYINGDDVLGEALKFFSRLREEARDLVKTHFDESDAHFSKATKSIQNLDIINKEAKSRRLIQSYLSDHFRVSLIFLSKIEKSDIRDTFTIASNKTQMRLDVLKIQKFLAAYLCFYNPQETWKRIPIIDDLVKLNEFLAQDNQYKGDAVTLEKIQDVNKFFGKTFIEYEFHIINKGDIKMTTPPSDIIKQVEEGLGLDTGKYTSMAAIIKDHGISLKKQIRILVKFNKNYGKKYSFYEPTKWSVVE